MIYINRSGLDNSTVYPSQSERPPTTMMDLPEGQFDMVNNILIEVLGTIAQQERETICKRQAEGIEAAKAKGKKFGRPALDFPPNWDKVYASWKV